MRLILVRHGETQRNLEGRAIGQTPEGLNPRGHLQALRTAEALASLAPSALYSSPLPRALETATIIARRLGVVPHLRDNLKEADIGLLDGLTLEETWQRYPDFMVAWSQDPSTVVMPEGESILQVQKRAWQAIEEIVGLHPEENVAVISHSFTLLGLLCKLLSMPLAEFQRLHLDTASITLLEMLNGSPTMVRYNDLCHLEGLERDGKER